MAISSVTVLNSDNVSTTFAKFLESDAESYLANLPQVVASSVSHISPAGKTLVSLESFQASAEAVLNSEVPPTVSDFKVLIQGVVSSINAIRNAQSNAGAEPPRAKETGKKVEEAGKIAEKSKEQADKLRQIGIESKADGELVVNPDKVVAAYARDGESAFNVLSSFVAAVTQGAAPVDSGKTKFSGEDVADSAHRPEKASLKSAQNREYTGSAPDSAGQERPPANSYGAEVAVTTYLAIASL